MYVIGKNAQNPDPFFRLPGQSAVVTAHPVLQDTSGSTIKAETDLLPSSVRVGTNNVLIVAGLSMGFAETGRPAWNEFIQNILSHEMRNMYLELAINDEAKLDNHEEKNKDQSLRNGHELRNVADLVSVVHYRSDEPFEGSRSMRGVWLTNRMSFPPALRKDNATRFSLSSGVR